MNLFRRAETLTLGDSLPWDAVLAALPFNADGLLPAIAQQADSGEVSPRVRIVVASNF